jgi:hypothetical protein
MRHDMSVETRACRDACNICRDACLLTLAHSIESGGALAKADICAEACERQAS